MLNSGVDRTDGTVDAFEALCALCGERGRFVKDEQPTRESYLCPVCGASLRYQGQALILLQQSRRGAVSIAELVKEPEFSSLSIWEPGELGPFRSHFSSLPNYEQTAFWPDVPPGESRNGLRCEDLMATTFASDAFDVIITSDVFEHVRKPELGFREIYRILRPGGAHVFSIPVTFPMPPVTVPRVDASGTEDVFLLEPQYHRGHLVYNDFGEELMAMLDQVGFRSQVARFASMSANASRLLTFSSVKP